MAVLGALAGGFSVVRSTRFGLSAIIDPLGRIRGWHSSFEGGDLLLMADVPRRHLSTVYAIIGDIPVYMYMALLIALLAVTRIKVEKNTTNVFIR
jgi:apolipoprotein N-acyltransferase